MQQKDADAAAAPWGVAAVSLTKPPGWFAGWATGHGPEGMVTRWASHAGGARGFASHDEAEVEAKLVRASWPTRQMVVVPLSPAAFR